MILLSESHAHAIDECEGGCRAAPAIPFTAAVSGVNIGEVTEAFGNKLHIADPKLSIPTTTGAPFWYQFKGFEPQPAATFKDEFARLAQQQKWGKKTKKKRRAEALTSEITFHHGTSLHKLDRWRELCEEMGVEEVPNSITKCKQVRLLSAADCNTVILTVSRR